MNKRMKIWYVILALCLAVGIVGCSNGTSSTAESESLENGQTMEGSSVDKKEITVLVSGTLNPELGIPTGYEVDFRLNEMIYEPLLKYGDGGEIEPCLAKSYEISDDGTIYTFKLREDVNFSDGTIFNADNVLWNAKKWDVKQFSSELVETKKIDEYTVEFIFKGNSYPCLIEFTYPRPFRMTCENAYEDDNFKKMIGTGMWMVESYQINQEVVLVPNPNYWGEKPKLNKITLKEVTDGETRLMAIQNGEADLSISDMPAESKDVIASIDTLDNLSVHGTKGFFVIFNSECEELKDINVRKAINYAVNKKSIVKDLLDGAGVPLKGILPENVPYINAQNSKGYEYNIEEAKRLLEVAGYTDSDEDGYIEKNGDILEIGLTFQTEEYAVWKSLCEYLQSELSKVGIKVSLDLRAKADYYDSIWKNQDYDMVLYRTYSDGWNPHGFMRSMFWDENGKETVCWFDEIICNGLDEVVSILDEEKRQSKYDEIFTTLNDSAYVLPLYAPDIQYAYNKRLVNLQAASSSYEAIKWSILDIE